MNELIDLVHIMKMIGCNIIQKIIQIIELDATLLPGPFECIKIIFTKLSIKDHYITSG